MFDYVFMQNAFIAGFAIALVVPLIGVIVVLKRLSMIGDALSHGSLAGVAGGLIAGIDPIVGASIASISAALSIEIIRVKFVGYAELAIALVMSLGIGVAGILSGFVPNVANFNRFLFGSLVTISPHELIILLILAGIVLLLSVMFFRELFFVALDEHAARMAGVKVGAVNFLFVLMTALTVSIAARTVGALIVSSLMVIPVACALQLAGSYKQLIFISVGVAVVSSMFGLFLSYQFSLRPGATIVLVGLVILLFIFLGKFFIGIKKRIYYSSTEASAPLV